MTCLNSCPNPKAKQGQGDKKATELVFDSIAEAAVGERALRFTCVRELLVTGFTASPLLSRLLARGPICPTWPEALDLTPSSTCCCGRLPLQPDPKICAPCSVGLALGPELMQWHITAVGHSSCLMKAVEAGAFFLLDPSPGMYCHA